MAISWRATGSVVKASLDTFNCPYPATTTAGDILIIAVTTKYPPNAPSAPAGWTVPANNQYQGGLGAEGSNAGQVYITVFTKIADGTEGGTNVAMTCNLNDVCVARMYEYQKGGTGTWDVALIGGADNTANSTAWSITADSNPGITAGDMMVMCNAVNANYTFTTQAMSATGITAWGTMTERGDDTSTAGDNVTLMVTEHPVNTGTASAPPVYTATASASTVNAPSGAGIFVRLRLATSTQYTQVVEGDLGFAGGILRSIAKNGLAGTLTMNGNLTSTLLGSIYALVSWVEFELPEALGNSITLDATLTFAGSITKRTNKTIAGVLSSAGAVAKQTARTLASVASFSGAVSTVKSLYRTITGALSFTGVVNKQERRSLSGTFSSIGSVAKQTARTTTGVLTSSGQLSKQTIRTLSGNASFSGAVSSIKSFIKMIAGSLSFVGTTSKRAGKSLSGSLSFSSTLPRIVNATRTGVLSFTSTVSKQTRRTLSGVATFVGTNIGEKIAGLRLKTIDGVLTFSGAVSKQTRITKSGVASFTSTLSRIASLKRTVTGVLSFVGTTSKQTRRTLSGTWSSAGSIATSVIQGMRFITLEGTLSFAGSLSRIANLKRTVSGVLSFAGAVNKKAATTKAGALSFVGTISKQGQKYFTASAIFSGQITRRTYKALSGAFSPAGQVNKRITRTLSATLSFASTVVGHVLQAGGMIEPMFRAMWKGIRKRF